MKKLMVAVALLGMVSCGGGQNPGGQTADRAELERELAEKDSLLNDVFASLSEISANLMEIKDREGIVTANASLDITKEKRVQINEDIAAINDLMVRNRATLEKLQGATEQLRRSNVRVKELETLIANYAKQIQDKDADIEELRKELATMQIRVAELHTEIDSLQTRSSRLNEEREGLESKIGEQAGELNTVYYIIGRERDLKRDEVIDKSGFIGRTVTMNDRYDLDKFTRVDRRELDRVLVGQRRATIVTPHPVGSYTLEMGQNNLLAAIEITDPERFWETSKVLVVSYK